MRPQLTSAQHWISVGTGLWLLVGLFIDGWAHNNLSQLETFFTPWHAVFYSGFLANALWIGGQVAVHLRRGRRGPAAFPVGYGLGLVGVLTFALGGLGDMIWHTIFGIEQGIDALFSPTHLLLYLGGALILSSPMRAAWHRQDTDGRPAGSYATYAAAWAGLTLVTGFTLFMFFYLWPFAREIGFQPWAAYAAGQSGRVRDLGLAAGVMGILMVNLMLFGPALLFLKRFPLLPGAITTYLLVNSTLLAALSEFDEPLGIVIPVVAGLLIEIPLRVLRPSGDRLAAYRAVSIIMPVLFWTVYFVGRGMDIGIAWSLEVWTGVIVWAGLMGLGLGILILPPSRPTAPQ